jgi:uncharacterized protein (DUF983 family)
LLVVGVVVLTLEVVVVQVDTEPETWIHLLDLTQ